MPYERKTWGCGESITSGALNNIEDGIEESLSNSSPYIVNAIWDDRDDSAQMDKTFGEIRHAFSSGRTVLVIEVHEESEDYQCETSAVRDVVYTLVGGGTPSAVGVVHAHQSFEVQANSAPYTLDALDALYPEYN